MGIVVGGASGRGVDRLASLGLRRAVRELGIEGRVLTQGPKENGLASFSYLARHGFDLIVGFVYSHQISLDAAALRFPQVCFLSLDGPLTDYAHRPANLRGTVYRVEQPAFLAGYLAALVEEQTPGRHVVSSIGGVQAPPVDEFIAGFRAGARSADPQVALLNGYALDFQRTRRCRALALQQIARGSGVVFPVAGLCGLGALQAAKEKGVWGIGADEDESSLGPHVLTSVLKRFDVALFRAIESLEQGTFRTHTTISLTLRDGGVGLGRISPLVPRRLVAKLAPLRRQITSGQIVVPRALGR